MKQRLYLITLTFMTMLQFVPIAWAQQSSWRTVEWNGLVIPIPPDFNAQWNPDAVSEESINGAPVLDAGAIIYPGYTQPVGQPYGPVFHILQYSGSLEEWMALERSRQTPAGPAIDEQTIRDTTVAGQPAKVYQPTVPGIAPTQFYALKLGNDYLLWINTADAPAEIYQQVIAGLRIANGEQPENGTEARTVTNTFQLTLYGDVPEGESFGVEYSDPSASPVPPLYFCGPETEVACTGNGTVYTKTVTFPLNFRLHFRFFRGFTQSLNFELFYEDFKTLSSDMTTSAYYTFGDAAPGNGTQDDADDTPDVPTRLPDTGLGGLPLGSVAALISLLFASGYIVRRRS
jgi:hypothetical protein